MEHSHRVGAVWKHDVATGAALVATGEMVLFEASSLACGCALHEASDEHACSVLVRRRGESARFSLSPGLVPWMHAPELLSAQRCPTAARLAQRTTTFVAQPTHVMDERLTIAVEGLHQERRWRELEPELGGTVAFEVDIGSLHQ